MPHFLKSFSAFERSHYKIGCGKDEVADGPVLQSVGRDERHQATARWESVPWNFSYDSQNSRRVWLMKAGDRRCARRQTKLCAEAACGTPPGALGWRHPQPRPSRGQLSHGSDRQRVSRTVEAACGATCNQRRICPAAWESGSMDGGTAGVHLPVVFSAVGGSSGHAGELGSADGGDAALRRHGVRQTKTRSRAGSRRRRPTAVPSYIAPQYGCLMTHAARLTCRPQRRGATGRHAPAGVVAQAASAKLRRPRHPVPGTFSTTGRAGRASG